MLLKRHLRTAVTTASLSFLFCLAAFGQATDGNIQGSVLDSSGSAVPAASIQATNIATGVKTAASTDSSGAYRISNLLVGTYKLTASATGFTPREVDGVEVALNVTSTVNITLTVGTVTSTVEVSAAAATIDTTTSQVTNTYATQMASELPVSANPSGGVLNLSLLGSGVASGGGVGVGSGPSVGGQRPRNNNFTIEGVDNNRKDVTGPVVNIPNDDVQDFSIIQNQFSAEFGHSSGGQFNTSIKSGTNVVHGAIWDYLENRNLNAIDQSYARQFPGQKIPPQPRFDRNRLGANIGGPIKRNKLFYFGSYQYIPVGQASVPSSSTYAPTAAGYALLANMSGLSQTNLGILKQYVAPAPVQAGSKITTVSGVAIPLGILPIVAPNFSNNFSWLVSADYSLSDRDQLHARYVDNKTAQQDTAANLPIFYTARPTTAHIASVSEFHNFSPSVVNEFRAAYNRYNDNIVVPDFKYPGLDQFPNIELNKDLNLNLGPNQNGPQATIQGVYQLVDNVSWVKGRHEFKFGFDGRDLIAASTFIQRSRGDYSYTSLELFLTDQFPDALAQRNVGAHPYSGNQTDYYGFANDNWKATRNLTINLGVRYEFNGVAQSMRLFDADALASTPGVLTFKAPNSQKKNFVPRVGFAYSPGTSGTTSIRGGFGIAYDQIFDNVGTNATPPQASATINSVGTAYPNGGYLASGGITQAAVSSTLNVAQAKAASSSYLPDQKLGYAITWNFGIQHVFAKDYTVEVRYLGNKGVHLLYQNQINRVSLVTPSRSLPIFYSAPTASTLDSLTYGICPKLPNGTLTTAPVCLTTNGDQSARNNPLAQYGYTSTITGYLPIGNSNYNGLATQLTRRFANGLLFTGAYTFSHLIDDSTAEVNSTTLSPRRAQDFANLSAEKASSALDHRHRFTMTTLYEVPWFKQGSWLKKNLLGNWQLSGVYTYESPEFGTPQSFADANLNGDSAGDRVVINPNGIAGTSSDVSALKNSSGATVGYLANNPSAQYIRALAGVYANSGRNILATRPIDNLDFSFAKSFSIGERASLQLRGDFLNGLNHPQYTPGSINNINSVNRSGVTNYLTPGDPLFGQFDQVYGSNPRNIQVAAKITF